MGVIGYIRTSRGNPFGGTIASGIAVIVFILLANSTGLDSVGVWYWASLVVITLVGIGAIKLSLRADEHDPRRAVIDEFGGVWANFAFIPVGVSWQWDIVFALAVFGIFRVLDLRKPFGLRYLERLPGAVGVMIDDIGAGLLGALFINAALFALDLFGVNVI